MYSWEKRAESAPNLYLWKARNDWPALRWRDRKWKTTGRQIEWVNGVEKWIEGEAEMQ